MANGASHKLVLSRSKFRLCTLIRGYLISLICWILNKGRPKRTEEFANAIAITSSQSVREMWILLAQIERHTLSLVPGKRFQRTL